MIHGGTQDGGDGGGSGPRPHARPLNLDLLGLVVDLQKVHLVVTATRGGGKLGDLLCQLADDSTTTTTTTTATTP